MLYPKLRWLRNITSSQRVFGGYVHTPGTDENSFYDMENLSSRSYPLLETRPAGAFFRGHAYDNGGNLIEEKGKIYLPPAGLKGVGVSEGKICLCTENKIYIEDDFLENVSLDSGGGEKSIVSTGRNVFIAPDGIFLERKNHSSFNVHHVINKFFCTENLRAAFSHENGTEFTDLPSCVKPEPPADKDRVLIKENGRMEISVYSSAAAEWKKTEDVYIKLIFRDIEKGFVPGDSVHVVLFAGSPYKNNITGEVHTIKAVGKDYILIDGILSEGFEDRGVSVEKRAPMLDFAVEHNNRIWGCRYGINENGDFVNEIYASALGDPCSWYTFEGLSTDSYAASLGVSGEFTGAAVRGNEVLFFKENAIITVRGRSPSDFTVTSFPARGVQKKCSRSIVSLNEKIFYKSTSGIMVYDGAEPYMISEALGDEKYTDASAGGADNRYYIALTDEKNRRNIFCFDLLTGLWHKYDDRFCTKAFVCPGGCLFALCETGESQIGIIKSRVYEFRAVDGNHLPEAHNILGPDGICDYYYVPEQSPEWFALTGVLGGTGGKENRILRKLIFTLTLGEDSTFHVSIKPEGETEWKRLCFTDTPGKVSFQVPVNTPPCHTYTLKYGGRGQCRISSVVSAAEITGEVKGLE